MKKSDIGLTAAMYGIVIFFFIIVMQYKPEVRIYPLFVMAVLFILNTFYLIKCIAVYAKERKVENDFSGIFKDFLPKQYSAIFFLSLAYIILISLVGFYPATLLYLVGTLAFLKVPVLHIVMTVVIFACLIYGAFSKFLHVPLPGGLLF